MLHIFPFDCIPAPRVRARAIRAKSGKSFVSIYNPSEYKQWQAEASALLRERAPSVPMTGNILLNVVFRVPKAKTTKLIRPSGDIDNRLKSLMDALTEAGWWEDDVQVTTVLASKTFIPHGQSPSTELIIENIK